MDDTKPLDRAGLLDAGVRFSLSAALAELAERAESADEDGVFIRPPPVAGNFFSDSQREVLDAVQMQLFPEDGDGPGARDLNALAYLEWAMTDPVNVDDGDPVFIGKGIGWLEDLSENCPWDWLCGADTRIAKRTPRAVCADETRRKLAVSPHVLPDRSAHAGPLLWWQPGHDRVDVAGTSARFSETGGRQNLPGLRLTYRGLKRDMKANETALTKEFDVCVVGSGAGGAPIAYELARAGYKTVVLEKGGWIDEQDFKKDEKLARRRVFRSKITDEPQVFEKPNRDGSWSQLDTAQFWGGNIVGGASNFMSGYFHRLKPEDFRLLSEFGPIEGANIADWPIEYDDLEPYYVKVEQLIGVSGKVVPHPNLEPRSTDDYPFPPAD